MTYRVVGHYCPTDCTPFVDSRPEVSEVECATLAEAESMLLWYPGGKIVPVQLPVEKGDKA